MSGPAEGDDVPELVKAASTSSSSPADPNFSGEWLAVSHDNLEALLRAQGVPERNLASALAASVSIRQSIRHTRHHFRVTVRGYTTTYLITGGQAPAAEGEEEEDDTSNFTPDQLLTGSTMEWGMDERDGSGARRKKLVVSSGAADSSSERRLVDGRMQVLNEAKGVRATSTFQRSDDLRSMEEEEQKEKTRAEQPQP